AMLPAWPEARGIGPGSVALGRLAVVFREPRPHLGDERPLQIPGWREDGVGKGVLRLDERPDVGRERVRVTQDLLPVLRPDPGVFVGPADAVGRFPDRTGLGAGRRERLPVGGER